MPDVKQIHRLQETDLGIEAREAELAEVTASLSDESEITGQLSRSRKLESELEDLATARRALERALEEIQQGLQKVEGRLYGGTVTNPKELEAAEEERKFLVARRGEHEDKLLDLMVDIESREELRAEAQQTLQRLETDRPGVVEGLTKKQARLTAELTELNGRRDDLTPQLGADVAALYESLRRSKGGTAVAVIERGMCQGCRLTLSTGQLQQARANQNLVQCSSCHRILYVA